MMAWLPTCKRIPLLALVTALTMLTGMASADFNVGSGPIPAADANTYPGGVNPVAFSITTTSNKGNFNPDVDSSVPGVYSYDSATHTFTIDNVANPNNIKHVSFEMVYANASTLPQAAGAVFDPTKWPTLSGAPGITPTDASGFYSVSKGANDIFMTWDINPQPASEKISIDFPSLGGNYSRIYSMNFNTICTPEPSSLALSALGSLMIPAILRRYRDKKKLG